MSYDNVIRVLYRGGWHGSKGEWEWSYILTRAGVEYVLHPSVPSAFQCRPDFKTSNKIIIDHKPEISTYCGEYPMGNIKNLIEYSRINGIVLMFVSTPPYWFNDYEDFMRLIKAKAMDETHGFHVFSLYYKGVRQDGSWVPFFKNDGVLDVINTDYDQNDLKEWGYDIEKSLSIYGEHPGKDLWEDSRRGNAPELKKLLNKEVYMRRDENLMWKPTQNDYDNYGSKHLDDGCLDWDGKIY